MQQLLHTSALQHRWSPPATSGAMWVSVPGKAGPGATNITQHTIIIIIIIIIIILSFGFHSFIT
jgi:hypothetical protein